MGKKPMMSFRIFSVFCVFISGALILPARAAALTEYNVACSVTALKNAIGSANADGDDSVLNLSSGCDYALTTADNVNSGNNGLPTIAADGDFRINGNNATIRRSNGRVCEIDATDPDTEFRMFAVSFGVGTVTINDLTVTDFCSTDGGAWDDGGAIVALPDQAGNGGADFVIARCYFRNNQTDFGGSGGALWTRDGSYAVTDSNFQENFATNNQGGAFYTWRGDVTVEGSSFIDNTADNNQGGAFYTGGQSSAVVRRCTFRGNTAENNQGGAIWSSGNDVTVSDSWFEDNQAINNQGGAIYSSDGGQLIVTNSTFLNNRSFNNGGGAVYSSDDLVVIANCTFRDNQTTRDGGALYSRATDTNVLNSTFAGNRAGQDTNEEGGAIYAGGETNLNVTNCTFVNNTDDNGHTFNDDFLTFTLKNSIVVNEAGDICAAPAGAGQDNLLSDDSCGAGATFNLGPVSNLMPLADYGGPTETFALGQGSNAIDAVTDCTAVSSGANPLFANGDPVITDQRGTPRPQRAACDIGAFEKTDLPVPSTSRWGIIFLAAFVAGSGIWFLKRRKRTAC